MEAVNLIVPAMAFLIALVIGLLIAQLLSRQFGVNRRDLQRRMLEYAQPSRNVDAPAEGPTTLLKERRLSAIPALQSLLIGSRLADRLAVDLAAARIPLRVGEYLLLRWLCAAAFVFVFVTIGLPLVLALAVGLLGFYAPTLYVGRRKMQRLNRFNDQIVDGLTMISNSMRAGSSSLQAFDLVALELPAPIGEEFGQVVAEVSVGATIEEALESLSKRVDSYDLYLVITAILVQRQAGGKLAEVLDQIAHTVRDRVRLLRQVQVLTAQERASAMMVGALPIIILVILLLTTPSYHGPFLATTMGRLITGVGFGLEILGFVVMNRLAKIDV